MYARQAVYPVSFLLAAAIANSLAAQTPRALIERDVNEKQLHVLAGNTRPEVRTATDLGAVEDDLPMEHMILQLRRAPEAEQALEAKIDSLHDPASPDFHHWMTAAEFGAAFGAAPADRAKITAWLESHGFTVNSTAPGGMTIDFSGTAANVREALHTEIHYLSVNGVRHIANMGDPSLPEALAPAVAGVVSLHDFSPRAMRRARPEYTTGSGRNAYQLVTPGDMAVIYDFNPLFTAGITGKGQTIAMIEDADMYKTSDWSTFRSTFGLAAYQSGSLSDVHPAPATGTNNCRAPGTGGGDDVETEVDAEWASAAAPDAAIVVAACASTHSTFGGLIALENLVNGPNPPAIVSVSYGVCEAENGAAQNQAFNAIYAQAVTAGISVFVASGDEGAASCDAGQTGATHGIGVSGFASTPNNVAVGGTDFEDTYLGTVNSYWASTNSTTYVSALSYIPEIPWNDSCASGILAAYMGFQQTYGSTGYCGSTQASQNDTLVVAAGSGGPSGCATGTPLSAGIVGGTCLGYSKPSWQKGVAGIAGDGVRDIPDVVMFAADGVFGHYYVDCWSDMRNGGLPCTGAPDKWDGGGGTSYSSPIMAGIQALVNQKYGGAQGNPNYVYYKLAAVNADVCNSSTGSQAGCIFHNVTAGDIDVNCAGSISCYGATPAQTTSHPGRHGGPGGGQPNYDGALSTSNTSLAPAYTAGAGWNFATGLGSVDAYQLVTKWKTVQ